MNNKIQRIIVGSMVISMVYFLSCSQKSTSTSKIPENYHAAKVGGMPTQYLLMRFHYQQDSITLQQVKQYEGKIPLHSQKMEGAEYRLLMLDSLDQEIFVRYFPTPGITYYDQADSTGKIINGGQVFLPEGLVELKIPCFHNLYTLKMISPLGKTMWQIERKNLIEAIIE